MSSDAPMNTSDNPTSMVIAIIIEPTTMNGARVTSRMNMATPCSHWVVSPTSRVMSDGAPIRSTSACESVFMCEYRPRLKLVPKPIDARDAKNCATSAKPSPTAASRNIYMPQRTSGP